MNKKVIKKILLFILDCLNNSEYFLKFWLQNLASRSTYLDMFRVPARFSLKILENIFRNYLSNLVYQAKSGEIRFRGDFSHDTIWATQKQIVKVFGVNSQSITRHIKNIYRVYGT